MAGTIPTMRRRLFTVVAAVSAVLCLAVCGLCVRSYFASDRLFWQGWEDVGDRSYWRQDTILSGHDGVGMNRIVQSGPRDTYRPAIERMMARRHPTGSFHRVLPAEYPMFKVGVGDTPVWGGFKRGGFAYMDPGRKRPRAYAWQVVVPYWALFAATVVLPMGWGWLWWRRRGLAAAGHCAACGYDLRASPDRCPECGAVPEPAKGAA